jgi:hypothetical protein
MTCGGEPYGGIVVFFQTNRQHAVTIRRCLRVWLAAGRGDTPAELSRWDRFPLVFSVSVIHRIDITHAVIPVRLSRKYTVLDPLQSCTIYSS